MTDASAPLKAGQKVTCIESGEGGGRAKVRAGEVYTVARDQNPALDSVWIEGRRRWKAMRFRGSEHGPA